MYTAEYTGINSFLAGASSLLLEEGVPRLTRGLKCYELPGPFMFKIKNPTARYVVMPERKWNPILPFAEALWLATGRNDLKLIGHYLKNMKNFSDDGFYLRGGYGPRLRRYNGSSCDYRNDKTLTKGGSQNKNNETDQLKFVVQSLKKDSFTRQAIISVGDPMKDCFDEYGKLKQTIDFPCTRLLHFQKNPHENKLNLTVYMRSNDILWGTSAVNIFNFTFIQEYISKMLQMEIGEYYHITNNFHYYEDFQHKMKSISLNNEYVEDIGYNYITSFTSLEEFDNLVFRLSVLEEELRKGLNTHLQEFEDEFFNDWYKTFYCFNTKKQVPFTNPILNDLFRKYCRT